MFHFKNIDVYIFWGVGGLRKYESTCEKLFINICATKITASMRAKY